VFTALASLAVKRPRLVVATAVALALVAAGLGGSVAERLDPYGAEDPATEVVKAERAAEAAGVRPGVSVVALVSTPDGVRSPAGQRRVAEVERILRSDRDVGRVTSYRDGAPALVSRDGRSTYLAVSLRPGEDSRDEAIVERLERRFEDVPGVKLGGEAVAGPQVNEQVSEDLARAELLAFPVLALLSFLFFRSLVASLLPLMVGGLSIVLTFLGLRMASELGSVSVFALNLVTGLGLGLAIDYSLFIVSRYREELERVGPGAQAIRRTLATAGRTVFFSALTVTAAMASLLVFPQRFLYSMGLGGMMVSAIAATVALTVLPAVLVLLGRRVNALAPPRMQRAREQEARGVESGFWYRLSRAVMRRPARTAIASAAVLVALGVPFLGIKFTSVDAGVLPTSASARQVDDTIKRDFPPAQTTPIAVVAQTPPGHRLDDYTRRLRALPGVEAVGPPQRIGRGATLLNVTSRWPALDERTQALVGDVRAQAAPFPVLAGGDTAQFVDLKQSLGDHLPLAAAIIVLATLVALFLMTGSVVLPLKAVLMNVLTLSAAFGVLVLIFQDGRLEGLLAYDSQGALESTQPIVLFALAFGLSTDYGVFLLSRIKEARDDGAPDREAVAIGLQRTGRIVTAAALLFCVAIGAFATSQIIFIKQVGLGTALAVLIDATLVRALLVPSLMELLGRWNWWAPRPLRRLHGRFGIGESDPAAANA
jgi:RND superfamily putative drug exporter